MPADEDSTAPSSPPDSANDDSGHRMPRRRFWRHVVVLLAVAAVVVVVIYYGIPWLETYFRSVSTDDAYIAGYVTYVGPRISSRVDSVTVNEDDSIRAGEVLVRLDPQPFRLAVEQAQAKLEFAQASLVQAQAEVRSQLASVRANQYLTQSAVDQLRLQIASLQSSVADLKLDRGSTRARRTGLRPAIQIVDASGRSPRRITTRAAPRWTSPGTGWERKSKPSSGTVPGWGWPATSRALPRFPGTSSTNMREFKWPCPIGPRRSAGWASNWTR